VRILITGATGFLGSYVLKRLLVDGRHEIAILVRPESDPWRISALINQVERIPFGLNDLMSARGHVMGFRPDAVIHLAWSGVGNRFRNDLAQLDNLRATADLVELSRDAGATSWVGIGSQAEYGPTQGVIHEGIPTRPTTLYGITKLSAYMLAEHLCAQAGIRLGWVRVFSTYGPMDDPSWMIPYLILKLLNQERPSLTPGTQVWDYLHAEDAARAIEGVASCSSASGVFNLGSGRPREIREIVKLVRDQIDPALPLGFGEVPFRPDQVMHLEADVARLRDQTGWLPTVSLEDGVRQTVTWFRENRNRYES
jgi:UDP-glucose 4-epimerase